ncbi:hypothetical protein P879_05976 [Paragonimus westermani]|uniref:Uncharacterized protein n=1 Tax=Paragonimus westermani TaxID=34504 RepID=A0A8T0DML9_9TREM|nr:hypothetical protein P879_05976 [Paragonimus westermani]
MVTAGTVGMSPAQALVPKSLKERREVPMPIFLSKKINNVVNEIAIIEWHSKDSLLAVATHSSDDSGDINVMEYQVS